MRLAREQPIDLRANAVDDGLDLVARVDQPALAVRLLGQDQPRHRLVAAGRDVRIRRFRSAFEVAAAPAGLRQVDQCLAVERPGTRHLLQLGPCQRQQPTAQVESGESGVDRPLPAPGECSRSARSVEREPAGWST